MDVGATVEVLQRNSGFRRFAVQRGKATTLVDLAIDRVPPAHEMEEQFGPDRVGSATLA